jgi:hypothetical protein
VPAYSKVGAFAGILEHTFILFDLDFRALALESKCH